MLAERLTEPDQYVNNFDNIQVVKPDCKYMLRLLAIYDEIFA